MVEEFKKMPKEGNRELYVQKIHSITQNYQKQRSELQKIIKEVAQQEENIGNPIKTFLNKENNNFN